MKFKCLFPYLTIIIFLSMVITNITTATTLQQSLELQGQGLTIVTDGVGLENLGSGTAGVTVEIGGPVVRAFLYWAGRDYPCQQDASGNCILTGADQDLIFDGSPITGNVIGEEINSFGATELTNNIGYRADVTAIVQSAGIGIQTFSIEDGDLTNNLAEFDGATLLVVYTDPAENRFFKLIVFDGLDYAYVNSGPVPDAQVTVPITFNYDGASTARNAQFYAALGSADSVDRCDRIDISDNPSLVDQINGTDGQQWDNLVQNISIPAGATSTVVQVFSPEVCATGTSESLLWELAVLRLPLEEENGEGEGCTPGYWKQTQHFDSWPSPYTPNGLFSAVFEDAFPGKTLLEVLSQGGGGLNALGRHTVAALLNAASPDVYYDLTEQDVIDMFNAVYPGGDYEDLKNYFEVFNEQGCPLD